MIVVSCAKAPEGRVVRDDLGREVKVRERVGRIVTLAPNVTEIVYAVGAGDRIVGTDTASDFPPPVRTLPKVGAMQPEIEAIVALQPDLVLASTEGNHPSLGSALEAAGIPLYVVRTDRLDDIPAALQSIGALLGSDGDKPAEALRSALSAERRQRPSSPKLVFVVWTDPLFVAGRETFTDDLFSLTGGTNVVSVSGWPQYSLEALAASPPELLLYPVGALSLAQVEELRQRMGSPALRIVAIDEDLFQRPGPRVAEAARRLNEVLDRF